MAHWTSISRKLFLCLTTALGLWTATVQADDFLPPEKAFAFSAKVVDDSTVRLHWDIAPGYHLYRERISVQADAQGAQLARTDASGPDRIGCIAEPRHHGRLSRTNHSSFLCKSCRSSR